MSDWISVKDRLPENEDEVLIYMGHYEVGWYSREVWRGVDEWRLEPTHWMPLPEPPAEKVNPTDGDPQSVVGEAKKEK